MKEAWLSHQRQSSLRTPLEPLSPKALSPDRPGRCGARSSANRLPGRPLPQEPSQPKLHTTQLECPKRPNPQALSLSL